MARKAGEYMKEMTMDRAKKRLMKLHSVIEWLLQNADHMPKDIYRIEKMDEVIKFIPVNILEEIFELVRQDFANAITPMQMWKQLGETEGFSKKDS